MTFLDRAEAYFETAYSYAEQGEYGTFQIDNHYARFLLVKAARTADVDTCMTSFRKARAIIERQIRDDRMHYPYRVARFYRDFYEVFESKLDAVRVNEIVEAATFVSKRIQSLPVVRRQHRNVEDCLYDMAKILEKKNGLVAEGH